MEFGAIPMPENGRIFRLAYASRAETPMPHPEAVALAQKAALQNLRKNVSGVLVAGQERFLQWLEGPAEDVCTLMARIAEDPRHRDVAVLSAGWTTRRRFAAWPMELAGGDPGAGTGRAAAGYDTDQAMRAFDRAADDYRCHAPDTAGAEGDVAGFAADLVRAAPEHGPVFPGAAKADLQVRARLVDGVCARFATAWRDDLWSATDITLGLANLNSLWQRAGRMSEALRPHTCVAIVVPPCSTELMGAIVKTDLLRSAGAAVRMILETDTDSVLGALARVDADAVIVAGPRVGIGDDGTRAATLARVIRARFPGTPIHLGGAAGGSLCDWPDRLAWQRDEACSTPLGSDEWLSISALAALATPGRGTRGSRRGLH